MQVDMLSATEKFISVFLLEMTLGRRNEMNLSFVLHADEISRCSL